VLRWQQKQRVKIKEQSTTCRRCSRKPANTVPLEHCHPAAPVMYDGNDNRELYLKTGVIVDGKKKSAGLDGNIPVKYGSQYQLYATLMVPVDKQEQTRSSGDTAGGYREIDVTSYCKWDYPDDILDVKDTTMTVKAYSDSIVPLRASYNLSAESTGTSYIRKGGAEQITADTMVKTKKLTIDNKNRNLLEYMAACKLVAVGFETTDQNKSVKNILKGILEGEDEEKKEKITAPISTIAEGSATIKEFCEAAIGGWTLVEYTTKHLETGLYGALFYTGSQYILVFRGTEPSRAYADIRYADMGIAIGRQAAQFKYAEELYLELCGNEEYRNNLILVGHSLGGALCDYLSVLHHHRCYTFNAPTAMMTFVKQDRDQSKTNKYNLPFARNFAGTDEGNIRHDYVNPKDFVGNLVTGSGLAKIPLIGLVTSISGVVLDTTIFVSDTSGQNGTGSKGAPYHSLEQMIKYNHTQYTLSFPDTMGTLTPTSESGFVPGSALKERVWKFGDSYYFGTSKNDGSVYKPLTISLPRTSISTYVYSGDGDDNIKICSHPSDGLVEFGDSSKYYPSSVICGGRGNDTFFLVSNGEYDYLYFSGDGRDKITADRQKVNIHIYDYNADLVKNAVTKLKKSGPDQFGYGTLSLSGTDSICLDMNGTGGYEIFAGDKFVGYIERNHVNSRNYTVKCPVNMYVYDASGNLCLELVDGVEMNEVRDYGSFSVYGLDGEYIKSATLYDENYHVEIVSFDDGMMDYRVEKTMKDAVEVRAIEGIPITKNAVYKTVDDFTEDIVLMENLGNDGTTGNPIVYCPPKTITLDSTQRELHYLEEMPLAATVLPEKASQRVRWSSSNTDVATVDDNGLVRAAGMGDAEITAESIMDKSVIATCKVAVAGEPIPFGDTIIEGLDNSYVYTGHAIEPSPDVWYGNQPLFEGIDYSLGFENNTETGTATITLTGEGYFEGSLTRNFDIRISTVGEKINQLVEECLASGIETEREKARWLHDWLIYNADYDYTYTEYSSDGVLLKGAGVCQSYADAYSALLTAVGIENIVVTSPEMNHAWNIAEIDGVYTHVDCTWDDPDSGGLENHNYFGLGDSEMAKDHIWDTSAYPACQKLPFQADESKLPMSFELINPVQGVEFTLQDKDGHVITREQIEMEGGNVLLVYGRPTCPNTMALLHEFDNWKPVLDAHNVRVVAIMEDAEQAEILSNQFSFICGYNLDVYELQQFNQRINLNGGYMYPQVVLQNAKGYAFYHSAGYVYEPEKLVATAVQNLPDSEQVPYSPVYFYSNHAEMKELICNAFERHADIIKICNSAAIEFSNEDVDVVLNYINETGLLYNASCNWYSFFGTGLVAGVKYNSPGNTGAPVLPSGTKTPSSPGNTGTPVSPSGTETPAPPGNTGIPVPPSGTETPVLPDDDINSRLVAKKLTLSKTNYVYNGKAQRPIVTVIDNKGNKISNVYYTVSYMNNKKVGKASVIVKLKNGYSGTLKKNFTIKPKETKLTLLTGKFKSILIKWAKQKIQTTGYQLQYSTNIRFSRKITVTKIVKKNTTRKLTAKKLKTKKTYYVRIRTYKTVNGKNYYSAWSGVKKAKTKNKFIKTI